ncbi:NAD(+) synthase [Thalassobacillus sp. CUG 92003]|uniref:NAD(+) synthase n=1 Tax=Thalassobacillus sp. CUG 92003 TaxID=2736641 RepID=UPI0015E635C6|nr:NAD(+) synthase [Thalassobacillus sp. CUG 92003]
MEERVNHLVDWLQYKVEESGLNGLLVGVSGGIDSAVVSQLIKRAAPDQSLGVILPIDQHVEDQGDALDVVKNAGLDYVGIELTETYQQLYGTIEQKLTDKGDWNEQHSQLGGANLQARLRMSTLYAVAANYGYLVVGTDNAAEHYTGYFTKYGDGGVDLVPLVHMNKSEVREMARYLEVPDSVISKAPSAGLWEGQSDESEMGVSYDVIDAYLQGQPVSDSDRSSLHTMHENTEHKRQMPAEPSPFKGE